MRVLCVTYSKSSKSDFNFFKQYFEITPSEEKILNINKVKFFAEMLTKNTIYYFTRIILNINFVERMAFIFITFLCKF